MMTWPWLGVGFVFLVAVDKGIKYALSDIVRLTQLDPAAVAHDQHRKHKHKHPVHVHVHLSVQTLKTLCQSPHPSIAAAACSLVIRRFAALPNAADILARDRESEDAEIRRKAVQAVRYLKDFDGMDSSLLSNMHYDLPDHHHDHEEEEMLTAWERQHRESGAGTVNEEEVIIYSTPMGETARMSESEWDAIATLEELNEDIARTERDMGALQASLGWDRVVLRRPLTLWEAPHGGGHADAWSRRNREAMVVHQGDGRVDEEHIIRPFVSTSP